MFIYEPMPFDLDTGYWARDSDLMGKNIGQPVGGTVRFAAGGGMLSQDLQHAGPFPLKAWWQDADQSAGPYLSLWTTPVERITPPEFVVLAGAPYDPCFVNGGCRSSTLEQIYNARATLRVVYLSVQPSLSGDWVAVPLRVADSNWHPGLGVATRGARAPLIDPTHRLFLPLVQWLVREIPVPAERPVGFFDPVSGRMVGYWAQ